MGLGNPGARFAGTRHNVGFDVVTSVAERLGCRLRKPLFRPYRFARTDAVLLAQPLTYMNRAGSVVKYLAARAGLGVDPGDLERWLIVCDNMDLPPGTVRLKRRGSSRSHNGIASVMDALGSGDFPRLYVGVGRPDDPSGVVEHVLSRPSPGEAGAYARAIAAASDAVLALADHPFNAVMNSVNSRS